MKKNNNNRKGSQNTIFSLFMMGYLTSLFRQVVGGSFV